MATAESHTETSEIVAQTERLTAALRTVLESTPASGLGPIEAARVLGVDKTLTSRLMASLRAAEPLAALHSLPGTSPLRQFLRAARAKGASRTAASAADEELAAFDQTLQRNFGTRTHLDAAIADSLPEARRRHQESARQAVFRGMALVKGVSIDLASINWVFHRNQDRPDRVDSLVVASFSGIRRLRPTARVRFVSTYPRTQPEGGAQLMSEFCRPSDLSVTSLRDETSATYEIASGSIRRNATSDIALRECLPAAHPADRPAGPGQVFAAGDAVAHAYKRLTLSMFIHRDIWVGCEFTVRAYDTATRGVVKLPDPLRELDRLDVDATVRHHRESLEGLRVSPVRGHAEMIRAAIAPRPWDLNDFHMVHSEVVYPLYGTEVVLVYEPPG
jgi:hypothetical protein